MTGALAWPERLLLASIVPTALPLPLSSAGAGHQVRDEDRASAGRTTTLGVLPSSGTFDLALALSLLFVYKSLPQRLLCTMIVRLVPRK